MINIINHHLSLSSLIIFMYNFQPDTNSWWASGKFPPMITMKTKSMLRVSDGNQLAIDRRSGQYLTLSGSRQASSNRNINFLMGNRFEISATSFEDILHPQFRGHTASQRHSDSNPRVSPRDSNSLRPATYWDRSRKSWRQLRTLISLLVKDSITTPPAHQVAWDNNG